MSTEDKLTEYEVALLLEVPSDKTIGNMTLRNQLGWDSTRYFDVRNGLVEAGYLRKGMGKGGSVSKETLAPAASMPDPPEVVAFEIAESYQREKDLYPKIQQVLEKDWSGDENMPVGRTLVEITADQGRKSTGGTWTRPDITIVAVHVYDLLPTKYLEVVTFEVKPTHAYDITGVFEAAAHQRAATRSFLAIHTPNGATNTDGKIFRRLSDECKRLGIGLITLDDPTDFGTYEVHVEAERRVPEPFVVNEFLTDQLSDKSRDKIRLWLK